MEADWNRKMSLTQMRWDCAKSLKTHAVSARSLNDSLDQHDCLFKLWPVLPLLLLPLAWFLLSLPWGSLLTALALLAAARSESDELMLLLLLLLSLIMLSQQMLLPRPVLVEYKLLGSSVGSSFALS